MNKGNLTINVGGMFSGKTSELLRQGRRHIIANDTVVYIKPNLDNRYSHEEIVSHTGDCTKALTFGIKESILTDDVLGADVVLIDEVQFFDQDIIHDILALVFGGTSVYCSGLDLTFDMHPFMVTAKLMCFADVVNKFKAVCVVCGEDAYISARKDCNNTEVVDIGADDKYIPLCKHCYSVKGALQGEL